MPAPLFTKKELDEIYDLYDDSINEGVMDGDSSTGHIKEIVDPKFLRAIRRGHLAVNPDQLIIDAAWRTASDRSAASTTQFIKDVNDGQTGLELDLWLDSPITVGKVKRTSIRFLLPEDMEIIVAVREQHWKDAGAVHASAVAAKGIIVPMLHAHKSMEAAVRVGGLILTAPAKVAV